MKKRYIAENSCPSKQVPQYAVKKEAAGEGGMKIAYSHGYPAYPTDVLSDQRMQVYVGSGGASEMTKVKVTGSVRDSGQIIIGGRVVKSVPSTRDGGGGERFDEEIEILAGLCGMSVEQYLRDCVEGQQGSSVEVDVTGVEKAEVQPKENPDNEEDEEEEECDPCDKTCSTGDGGAPSSASGRARNARVLLQRAPGGGGRSTSGGSAVVRSSGAKRMKWSMQFGVFRGLSGIPAGRFQVAKQGEYSEALGRVTGLTYAHPLAATLDVPDGGVKAGEMVALCTGSGRLNFMSDAMGNTFFPVGASQTTKTVLAPVSEMSRAAGAACLLSEASYIRASYIDGSAAFFDLTTGQCKGYISSEGKCLDSEQTLSYLSIMRDEEGTIRQVWNTWDGLADIVEEDENDPAAGYTVRIYPPAQVEEPAGDGELFTTTGEPVRIFTVRGNDAEKTLRIAERDMTLPESMGEYVTTWKWEHEAWSQTTGEGEGAVETHREAQRIDETHYSVVESLRKDGKDALSTYEEYESGNTGNLLKKRIVGYGHPGARTTTYEHNIAGQLIKVVEPGGGTRETVYDMQGRPTVQSAPWREEDVSNTHTVYRSDTDVYSTEPLQRELTYTSPGEVSSALYEEYSYTEENHVKRVEKRTRCEAHTLLTVVETWLGDAPNEYAAGRIKMEQVADGVQTHYSYASADGKHGALYTTTAETRDENGQLVPGQSKREVSYITAEGNTVREESYVLVEEEHWQLVDASTLEYDVLNRHIATTWDNGRNMRRVLTCQGELLWEEDADGVVTSCAYNSARQLIETTRSAVYDGETCITPETITEYERDAAGNVLKTTQRIGALTRSTSTRYDMQGRVVEETDALGRLTTTAYSEDGLTTTVTTPSGATLITRRNPDGTIAEQSGSGQRHLIFKYKYAWGLSRITYLPDGETIVQAQTINALEQRVLLSVATTLGNGKLLSTRRTYNAKGQLVREKEGELVPFTFAYDNMGNLSRRTRQLSSAYPDDPTRNRISKYSYSYEVGEEGEVYAVTTTERSNVAGEWLTSVERSLISKLSPTLESKTITTDERGNTTTTWTEYGTGTQRITKQRIPTSNITAEQVSWDGFVISQKDSVGITTTSTRRYGENGVVYTATDGRGNTTTTTTDIIERPVKVVNAAGDTTTTQYCPWNDLPACVTDALGNTACTEYDCRNRKVAEYGTGIQPATFDYDDADRLIALTTWRDAQQTITTDPRGMNGGDTTRWKYNDASGLEVRKTYANGLGSEMTYDAANRLETVRNARGELTSYTYNKLLGYVTKISFSDENTPQQTFKYNIADQPTQIVDAAGTRVFTYNEYEQLATETLTTEKTKFAVREAYDTFGRSTGYAFLKGNTAAHTVSTGYAENGRIATAGFLHGGTERTCRFAYLSGSNLLEQLTLHNGVVLTQTWEEKRNLLARMLYKRSNGAIVADRAYTYDKIGRPTARTVNYPGKSVKYAADFGYNGRSELTSARLDKAPYAYAYDNIGNRTTAQEDTEHISYTANELNQYTQIVTNGSDFTPEFDADGNQTRIKTSTGIWKVEYNAQNRAVRYESEDGSVVIDCIYDYMGRRARKKVTINGEATVDDLIFYRGYLQVAAYDWLSSAKSARRFLVWDPTEPVVTRPLAIRMNNTAYAYGWDLTKNITEIYGPNGYIVNRYLYSPYGQVTMTESTIEQPVQWSSEMYDTELGLVYYNYRYYNPPDGRWTRRDPIEEESVINLYFAWDGVLYIDILGLESLDDKCKDRIARKVAGKLCSEASNGQAPSAVCKEIEDFAAGVVSGNTPNKDNGSAVKEINSRTQDLSASLSVKHTEGQSSAKVKVTANQNGDVTSSLSASHRLSGDHPKSFEASFDVTARNGQHSLNAGVYVRQEAGSGRQYGLQVGYSARW